MRYYYEKKSYKNKAPLNLVIKFNIFLCTHEMYIENIDVFIFDSLIPVIH